MKKKICFAILLSCGAQAFAGSSEFVPLQQRAQGQSLTGASLLNDSLFSNPASSALTNVYSIDGTFLSPKIFSVSVLDTKTSSVGGALGYSRFVRPGMESAVQSARLGISGRLGQNIGIGAVGKMVWGPGLNGADTRYNDVDLGMLAQFDFLQVGLSIHNTFGGNVLMGEQREYAVGTRLGWEQTVFLSASVTGDMGTFRPTQFGFGAEYVSPYYFSLKGGFRTRPSDNQSFWGAGVSILSPKVSVHYAAEFPNQPGASIEHSVGTTFLF